MYANSGINLWFISSKITIDSDLKLLSRNEVEITVIATGFEKPSEPLYHSFNSTKREDMYKDNDDDYNDNDLDIPPFIRDRQDF